MPSVLDPTIIREVARRMRSKRSSEYNADKIGISEEEYLRIRERIAEALESVGIDDQIESYLIGLLTEDALVDVGLILKTVTGSPLATHRVSLHNTDPELALRETSEDLEAGTSTLKGISVTEPRSAADIVRLLQIDTSKWALKQYWNKEKNGRWEISALVARRDSQKLDLDSIEQILTRVFADITVTPHPIPQVVCREKMLTLYPSDKHIGAHVDQERSMYGNAYSAKEYEARMDRVLQETLELAAIHGPFEVMLVADMGDKLDGYKKQTTRGGHDLPQNANDRHNYETCLRVEKAFVDRLVLSGAAGRYIFYQNAESNHGGDFEYFVSRHIQDYINLRYPEVETRIQQQFIEHLHYGIHTILLTHGKDSEEMKHGLPRHLSEKAENLLNKYLMYHNINTNERVVTIAKGDLHVDASEYAYGFRYRNVASLFGSSKWIQTNFGPGKPGCSFDIYSKSRTGVLQGLIRLDELT